MTSHPTDRLTRGELTAFVGLLVAYGIAVAIGRATFDEGDAGGWPRWCLAGVTIGIALAAIGLVIRRGRRTTELDRFVFSESTSIAFFATMLGALTYGLLESVVDAPRLSAWATWMFGMATWAVVSLGLQRSMR